MLDDTWGGFALVVVAEDNANFRLFDDSLVKRGGGWTTSSQNTILWRAARPLRRLNRRARTRVKRLLGRTTT